MDGNDDDDDDKMNETKRYVICGDSLTLPPQLQNDPPSVTLHL